VVTTSGLILEFFNVLEVAKNSRGALLESYEQANAIIAVANTVEGAIGVRAAAMSVGETPEITLNQKNIMGVVVPDIESTAVCKSLG